MRSRAPAEARQTVAFWRAAGFARWFSNDAMFDALTRQRLGRLQRLAAADALDGWDKTPEGALALLVLLDQAPRNLFRGTKRAFATDEKAVAVATAAIARGFDRRVTRAMRQFFYLPFEHAEDMVMQRESVRLFSALGAPETLRYAEIHADVITRFGRFPHRNAILGRVSTAEERAFLTGGGFSG